MAGPDRHGDHRRMLSTTLKLKRLGGLVLAALTLAIVPAAHADSISYVKDGDIWLTTPDGPRQVRVTNDGGYSFASQADDGTLIGLRGKRPPGGRPAGRRLAALPNARL